MEVRFKIKTERNKEEEKFYQQLQRIRDKTDKVVTFC